jgi:hypothetical protein
MAQKRVVRRTTLEHVKNNGKSIYLSAARVIPEWVHNSQLPQRCMYLGVSFSSGLNGYILHESRRWKLGSVYYNSRSYTVSAVFGPVYTQEWILPSHVTAARL